MFRLLTVDVPRQRFPTYMQVAVAYSRTLEPYDTGTGLVVQNVTSSGTNTFGVFPVSANDIANHGMNLLCIVRANGEHEFVAFESATSLGGGQLRLNNVWRGLMDTPAIDHSVGEYAFVIEPQMVGRKAWSIIKPVTVQAIPSTGAISGTASDPVETFPTMGPTPNPGTVFANGASSQNVRSYRPLPPANFYVYGEGCQGTLGIPVIGGTTGAYKAITLLEEAIDPGGYKRELLQTRLVRGDNANDQLYYDTQTTFIASCAPTGLFYPRWTNRNYNFFNSSFFRIGRSSIVAGVLYAGSAVSGQFLSEMQYSLNWYGNIDIGMDATTTILPTMPAVGKGGLDAYINSVGGSPVQNALLSYATPRVTAFAPSWRNLLANVRWNYQYVVAVLSSPVACWFVGGGAPAFQVFQNATNSLSRATTGVNSYILGATGTTMQATQEQFVSSWFPRGLTAIGSGYIRNFNADANDTGHLDLIDDATGSATGTSTIGPTTNWQRVSTSMVMTAASTLCNLKLNSTEVAGGGSGNADTCWSEIELRLGQFQSNVLTNYSFDTGTFTGWTNITNSMVAAVVIPSPSNVYAQGGAFSSSAIRQEFALPTGWTGGATAFLTCFRAQTIASDTGTVTISAIDGGGATVATSTTGAENFATLNLWIKRTIFCDVPETAVKIRVDLTAVRTARQPATVAPASTRSRSGSRKTQHPGRGRCSTARRPARSRCRTRCRPSRAPIRRCRFRTCSLVARTRTSRRSSGRIRSRTRARSSRASSAASSFQTSTDTSFPVTKTTPTSFGVIVSVNGWTFTRGSGAGAPHLVGPASGLQARRLSAAAVVQLRDHLYDRRGDDSRAPAGSSDAWTSAKAGGSSSTAAGT